MTGKIVLLAASALLFCAAAFYTGSLRNARAEFKGDPKAGLEIHKKHCLRCHGEQGKGDGPGAKLLKTKPADWTDKEKMSKLTDEELIKIIAKGGDAVGKSKLMPAFGEKLTEQEVRNIVAFIRSLTSQ